MVSDENPTKKAGRKDDTFDWSICNAIGILPILPFLMVHDINILCMVRVPQLKKGLDRQC